MSTLYSCFQLKDGYFGRTDTSTCIGDSDPAVDPAEIPCQDVSVHDLEVIRDCNGRRQCIFDVTKDVLGINPCPSRTYPKYLNLTYNCISKSHILPVKFPYCERVFVRYPGA